MCEMLVIFMPLYLIQISASWTFDQVDPKFDIPYRYKCM